MFQENKPKILGLGATPTFHEGIPFYIQKGVISKRNQAPSSQMQTFENSKAMKVRSYKELIGIDLLVEQCEDQDSLIQEQDIQIKELQKRLKCYEVHYQKENRYPTIESVGYTMGGV